METYLEDEAAVTPEMIRRALRKGTLAGRITPVLAGSAFKNKGVQPLLDAIVDPRAWTSRRCRASIEEHRGGPGQRTSTRPSRPSPSRS